MDKFIDTLRRDFPGLNFELAGRCFWSPQNQTIYYKPGNNKSSSFWAILHELGHAVLNHSTYDSDFELLTLEISAWQEAEGLAAKYGHKIASEHIQNCLDTYREWLYRRSTCPKCQCGSLQQNATTYSCFNCRTTWKVSSARFCRPYRKISNVKEKPLDTIKPQAVFH